MTHAAPRPAARYEAGTSAVVVAPGGTALLVAGTPDAVVEQVWNALDAGAALPHVIEVLTGTTGRLVDMPSFAVVLSGTPTRLVVRGEIEAHVTDATGAVTVVTGTGVATWTEIVVDDAKTIELRDGAGAVGGGSFPLADGIVRASAVTVRLTAVVDAASAGAPADAAPAHDEVADAGQVVDAGLAVDDDLVVSAGLAVDADLAVSADQPIDDAEAARIDPPVPDEAPGSWDPVPWQPDAPAASAPIADLPAWVSEDVASSRALIPALAAPEAPVAESETPAPETPAGGLALDTVQSDRRGRYAHLWGETVLTPSAAIAAAARASESEGGDVADDLVVSVPAAESLVVRAGDHDGATMSLAEFRRLRDESLPPVPAVPAAEFASLELSTGRTIVLDRGVVIGRRPRAVRVGAEGAPQLIGVDSPHQDISRSHIEVRCEGESHLVVDLDTTNGTILHREGSSPMRLHPGEATILLDGDVLDLGDEVTVTFRESR